MDVADKNGPKPFSRILATLVNIHARKCRAKMLVIYDRGQQLIRVRICGAATLPDVMAAGRHMKEVVDHASADKCVSDAVEVDAPGIARSIRKDFERFGSRM